MRRLIRLARTSIGRKLLMALSGLLLVLFLTAHLLGNLKVLQGPEAFNAYAAWLQGHPVLWVMRLGLLLVFALHTGLGIHLALANRAARPSGYAHPASIQMSLAERHIALSGVVVLAFVVYHLLHLTFGAVDPTHSARLVDAQGRADVYARVVTGFRNPWLAASYLLALLALAAHLTHAVRSALQTLGASHESHQAVIELLARAVPAALVVGFAAIPLLALLGVLEPPGARP